MGHGYRPIISKIRCDNPNKKGIKVKNYNMLHYIATREGVDLTNIDTIEAAINENIDLNEAGEEKLYSEATNEAYLKYITHRPRSHGLFGNIDTENFGDVSKVLNKVSNDRKCVYKGIVSLAELDAQALGYDNAAKWNLYLKSVMPDIALTLGLSPNNITWVGAFHAEKKHPHVHYILWDNRDIVQSPFIHKEQQIACREICQKAMFTDENEAIIREITAAEREEHYKIQNTSRNKITDYFKSVLWDTDVIPGVYSEKLPERMTPETHKELNQLYKQVLASMPGEGRIAYKYMPQECKAYIDRISEIFMKQPDIRGVYREYIDSVKEIHRSLGKTKDEINQATTAAIKELQNRTGNIVLKGVCGIKSEIIQKQNETVQDMVEQENISLDVSIVAIREPEENNTIDAMDSAYTGEYQKQVELLSELKGLLDKDSDKYNPVEGECILLEKLKEATPELEKYIYKRLGELYADSNSIMENYAKAIYYLEECLTEGEQTSDVQVLLGKIYSDKSYSGFDIKRAEECYLKAIEDPKKNYIKLRLSRMYMDTKSQLCDFDKALDILTGYTDKKGSVSLQKANIYAAPQSTFYDMQMALNFYKNAAEKNNSYGAYNVGKILSDTESPFYDLREGIAYLEKAAEASIMPAQIKLGKLYMDQESVFFSIPKAYQHLSNAMDSLKALEDKQYCKLSKSELQSKALICFYMGKIYAGQNSKHDCATALEYYKLGIDAYEKMGDTNNVIVNQLYIRMAQIYTDKNEKYYNPMAAEQFLHKALNNMAVMLEPQIPEEKKFHENTLQNIKFKLCNLYMDDTSILWNLDKAMSMLQGINDEKGFFALRRGNIYANDKYSGYSMQKAVECYRESAECQNTTAMVKIGKCCLYGLGVTKDKDEGLAWLNKAVELGDEYARDYLRNMESMKFNHFTYAMLRQIFSSVGQKKQQSIQRLQEAEFKTDSKQARKEQYLHRN